jgi:hypothetical protein
MEMVSSRSQCIIDYSIEIEWYKFNTSNYLRSLFDCWESNSIQDIGPWGERCIRVGPTKSKSN